jgi:CheY-like chemotaxis protein/HPt (histidine-containing phosphotransfer) domain-containing protein
VRSVFGLGSTFWFTLRLEGAPRAEARRVADERLARARVLAVDDNATNREILLAQLSAAGMRCEVAAGGSEALECLVAAAARGEPYALAILDQHMPEMDGCELARRIKADPRIAPVRLVMLASIGRPLEARELQSLGVVAWATKPVWRMQLLRALSAAMGEAADAQAPQASPLEPSPLASGRRVLLVEDTPINAEVVVEILRTAGYSVDVAVDGYEAIEAAARSRYDLVLMDCQLPGIDGYEATRRIRTLEAPATPVQVPILALTASATREDLDRARLAGMDDHIAKPVDARRLLAAVASHLQTQRAAAAPEAAANGATAPSPRVVDLDRALERLQGNRDLLDRMIAQLVQDARGARSTLRERLAARERDALGFTLHRLRGLALALDASAMAEALGTLERLVAAGQWDACGAATPPAERAIDELLQALDPRP